MGLINILYLVIATVVILVFFRVARMVSSRSSRTQRYLPLLSGLELILWVAVVFWSLRVFFMDTLHTVLVLLTISLLTLLLVWFLVKDVIAGFLFGVRHNPIVGQVLQTSQWHGTIKKIGIAQLTIETTDGQWLRIPYSLLITQTLSLHAHHTSAPGESVVRLKLPRHIDPIQFEQRVRETLALSSWCIASKPITVRADATDPETIEVSFFLINPSYRSAAIERLTKLADK